MSAQAMQVLLFWAAQNSRKVQRDFIVHYGKYGSTKMHDEAGSGTNDMNDRIITSDGMRQLIWGFEEMNDLPKTNLDRTP